MKNNFKLILSCIILTCLVSLKLLTEPENAFSMKTEINQNKNNLKTKSSQLETLLKELNLEFIKVDDNCLKVPIEIDGEISVAYIHELLISPKDPDSKFILVSQLVLQFPDDYQPSLAMLREMAYINNNLTIGTIGIDKEVNAIIYHSSIWADNITKENLQKEIYVSHYMKIAYKELFTNYINK